MASPTITVRFDRELYNKIKNHELNASDLIRTSVVEFLEKAHLSTDEDTVKHEIIQDVEQVITDEEIRNVNNFKNVEFPVNKDDVIKESEQFTPIINELKEKIDELDKEIEFWIEKYNNY